MNDSTAEAESSRYRAGAGQADDVWTVLGRVLSGRSAERADRESPEVIKLMARHAPLSI